MEAWGIAEGRASTTWEDQGSSIEVVILERGRPELFSSEKVIGEEDISLEGGLRLVKEVTIQSKLKGRSSHSCQHFQNSNLDLMDKIVQNASKLRVHESSGPDNVSVGLGLSLAREAEACQACADVFNLEKRVVRLDQVGFGDMRSCELVLSTMTHENVEPLDNIR